MLGKIRVWNKTICPGWFGLELLVLVGKIVGGLAAIVLLVQRRDWPQVWPALVTVALTAAVLGFIAWVYFDARRTMKKIRQRRRDEQQEP